MNNLIIYYEKKHAQIKLLKLLQFAIKAAVRNFVLKMYISEYTMNPFSKPCFWLVLHHYGTIISVYIQIIRLVRVGTTAE